MSYPWWGISAEREAREAKEEFKRWRTRLVKIGEEALRELDAHGASDKIKSQLREFIEEARAAGIYWHSS